MIINYLLETINILIRNFYNNYNYTFEILYLQNRMVNRFKIQTNDAK